MTHRFKTLAKAQKHTEALLKKYRPPAPKPTGDANADRQAQIIYDTTVANLNNRSGALAGFWESPDGLELKTEIIQKTIDSINTPELLAWWDEFNAKFPPEGRAASITDLSEVQTFQDFEPTTE